MQGNALQPVRERGVLPGSRLYYNTPSQIARTAFFNIAMAGDFYCDSSYRVKRDSYYKFLLVYVHAGKGVLSTGARAHTLGAQSTFLIDCSRPHEYFAIRGWRISWIHFDGASSRAIYDLMLERGANIVEMQSDNVVPHYLSLIMSAFEQERPLPEALSSSYVHRMLSEMVLVASGTSKDGVIPIDVVEDAVSFIQANYSRSISVSDLAAYVHLSAYHFSRTFKLQTGYAPYEYVIKTRIGRACQLLRNSTASIANVAHEVGFASESNFISTFRRFTNQTPSQFRRTPL